MMNDTDNILTPPPPSNKMGRSNKILPCSSLRIPTLRKHYGKLTCQLAAIIEPSKKGNKL